MKLNNYLMAVTVLASLTLAASLQAQVTNVIAISATASVQNPNTSDNGTITTTPSPAKESVTTKQILSALAADENAEANYGSNTFPAGAKLVVIGGGGLDFQVLDKNNHLLVDVSDIISGQNTGTFGSDVLSGKSNDNTSLASPSTTDVQIFTFSFDDTFLFPDGQDVQFYLTGLLTNTTTDSTPKSGVYKETQSHTGKSLAGDGNFQGNPLVISGSFTASGSANLSL